jgi:hypothetical protein
MGSYLHYHLEHQQENGLDTKSSEELVVASDYKS